MNENKGTLPNPQGRPPQTQQPKRQQNSSTWEATELLLQKKAEVLLNRDVYPCLQRFPKSERFSLCQDMKQTMSRVIRGAILSNVRRGAARLAVYEDVDADLKYMLVLIGISRAQKYITEKKAEQWQKDVSELGRILGGLIKATKNNMSGAGATR